MIRKYLPKSTEELIHWYERYISPVALITGFLLDYYIFLDRIDSLQSYAFLSAYLTIAALSITLINAIESGRLTYGWVLRIAPFIPVVMQFSFGGLFSGFLSVYSRSASALITWVFVLVIAGLLIGNERFRKAYTRLPFQVGVYFIALFSFSIFLLPILFHRIGSVTFVLSGIFSLALISLLLYLLWKLLPDVVMKDLRRIAVVLASIFIIFNILYFTNAIPPLPLALKESGVYHSIVRVGDGYKLTGEKVPWYRKVLPLPPEYHRVAGESAYVYTAIFAPTGLATTILHEWQHYDAIDREWVTQSTVRFVISGGRDAGFRGYSVKNGLPAGAWRVNALTQNGQIIGRVSFTVVYASSSAPVVEEVR